MLDDHRYLFSSQTNPDSSPRVASLRDWLKRQLRVSFHYLPGPLKLRAIILAYHFIGRTLFFRSYLLLHGKSDAPGLAHGLLPRIYPEATLHVLMLLGAGDVISEINFRSSLNSNELDRIKRQSLFDFLFDQGDIGALRDALREIPASEAGLWKYKLLVALLDGEADEKVSELALSNVWSRPEERRAHQNLAARYGQSYVPNDIDFFSGRDGALFDLCNYLGQRLVHVGLGDLAIPIYARALEAQDRLRRAFPPLSNALIRRLADWNINIKDLRIAPQEWTTQIGHNGFLDFLIRMRTLGWWEGKLIILASPNLIANYPCLSLFAAFGKIIVRGQDLSVAAWEELSSLQRWSGLNFNVGRLPSGEVVNWPDASALAAQEWDAQGLGHPLRQEYARRFAGDPLVELSYEKARQAWGMRKDDWFVCLHMREPSFYGESRGSGQTHRNSEVDTYLDAIKYIISQGGFVLRLGSSAAPSLPDIPGLIDYAKSPFKSPIMDLHLLYYCRFFIGTTSGLGNIANSFGIPMALVNCLTIDGQLWHRNVRFILKEIIDGNSEMLSQRAITSDYRWLMFAYEPMKRYNLTAVDNKSDEILEIVKEVKEIADGIPASLSAGDFERLNAWRKALPFSYFYGASQPSKYYLSKHERTFLGDTHGERASAP
jgi:putative glycosyltransferase (TIGR04372 family)